MPRPHYRVKKYKHPRLKWVVRSKLSGRWERKFFETKGDADTYVQLKENELLNQGKEGATFPTALRVEAQLGNERLRPFGKTLTNAVDHYVRYLEEVGGSVPLKDAVEKLIQDRKDAKCSDRYVYEMGLKLKKFCASYPDKSIAEITTEHIASWLAGLRLKPTSTNTFHRDLSTLFEFAVTRNWCKANPAIRATKAKEVVTVGILTVDEVEKLLKTASKKMVPFIALGAFAGLRRAEIERMDWSQINFRAREIHVQKDQAKTGSHRIVAMKPNLIAWLTPYRKLRGPICPEMHRVLFDQDRDRAGLLEKWPSNALRHSYGSYHLSRFQNRPELAEQMGNSVKVINDHYRKPIPRKDARRYWNIKPPPRHSSRTIVQFAAA